MNSPFEIVTTTAGAISIRNIAVNEIMHNPVGPWAEANALYVEQSELRENLQCNVADEWVVYDVGLGAAANALATLHCANSLTARRPLRLISFERDLDLLKFALEHSDQFAHFSGYESALKTLLDGGEWQGDGVHWHLRHGDFLDTIDTEIYRPHAIFFDPYSPKMNREMWSTPCFKKLRARCREADDGGTILFTYSQATPIRAALLAAGFYVGYGTPTGLKEETTQAATTLKDLKSPLGERWLRRWTHSHTAYPYDCAPEDQPALKNLILGHEQFNIRSAFEAAENKDADQ